MHLFDIHIKKIGHKMLTLSQVADTLYLAMVHFYYIIKRSQVKYYIKLFSWLT